MNDIGWLLSLYGAIVYKVYHKLTDWWVYRKELKFNWKKELGIDE